MIIGLTGYARTGKDTVADILATRHGFQKRAFADPMREGLYRLNPAVEMDGYLVDLARAVDLCGWEYVKGHAVGFRGLMQRFGTSVGRELWGADFWVNQAMSGVDGLVVFSDVRFPNEADAIQAVGGHIWRIVRPDVGAVNSHVSEVAMDCFDVDAVISNDGDLPSLVAKVESLVGDLL